MNETQPNLVKYPRTPHLPWSLGATDDDKVVSATGLAHLQSGVDLVVSEKMDGGNLTWYRDAYHGRSLSSGTHAWDTRARAVWAQVRYSIPEGWRVSGESMMARRSVPYDNLPGVFMVFGIWDDTNTLLPWDEMLEWADLFGLPVVPTLYRGNNFDEAVKVWGDTLNDEVSEGFVVRDAGRIPYDLFGERVAKMVRANHVRTNADWRHRDDFALNTFA